MNFWLIKSEPDVYSIDHLAKDRRTLWTGVRNYQARNFMTRQMAVGDKILFYHSNAEPSGVAGIAKVASTPQPDPTQFEKKSAYFDAKSTREAPRWLCVEVAFVRKLKTLLPLAALKADKALDDMELLRPGSRLSIQPVGKKHFEHIVDMA